MHGSSDFQAHSQDLFEAFAAQMGGLQLETLQQFYAMQYESAEAAARERIAEARILADFRLDPRLGARSAAYEARIRNSYLDGVDRGYNSGMSI